MTLRLAPGLALPDDFATQGVAIIGVRGSGKSNTEVRYAELLHKAGIPFVAVDPKGDWYGIRMEGTGPGLPIPVFGGLYGDFPLEDHLGDRIADLLVDENLSAVLDVSRLSKTKGLPRFLVAFCNRLMDRHQQEPHVRCVVLEEAHRYIPQVVKGGPVAELKEAAASVLLEGRAFGLGCWACTQRPARLHNDVLEEVDTAIIHRIGVTATADLKRVREWVRHEDLSDEIAESLTKLRNGEAWVLSPTALEVVQRVQIDRRTTFDSGASPTTGASKRVAATMATIDAGAIKEALSDAIERAKADDPSELRRRAERAEAEAARARARAEEAERRPVPEPELKPFVPEQVTTALYDALRAIDDLLSRLNEHRASVMEALDVTHEYHVYRVETPALEVEEAPPGTEYPRALGPDERVLGGGAPRRMLEVLADWAPAPRTRAQIAAEAGVRQRASTVRNAMTLLRRLGYVTEAYDDVVSITPAGAAAVGDRAPRPSGEALLDHWRSRLGGQDSAPRRLFDVLVEAWPNQLSREALAARAEVDPTKSTLRNALTTLRLYALVDEEAHGLVRANREIMEAAR